MKHLTLGLVVLSLLCRTHATADTLRLTIAQGVGSLPLHLAITRDPDGNLQLRIPQTPDGLRIAGQTVDALAWEDTRVTGDLRITWSPRQNDWSDRRITRLEQAFLPRLSRPREGQSWHTPDPDPLDDTYTVRYRFDLAATPGLAEEMHLQGTCELTHPNGTTSTSTMEGGPGEAPPLAPDAARTGQPPPPHFDFGPYHPPMFASALTADLAADAPQQWIDPAGWEFFGPVPATALEAPLQPEPPDHATWLPLTPDASGVLRAPEDPTVQPTEEPHFAWYARTSVDLASAGARYLALQVFDHGTLWVNGHRVWHSAPTDNLNHYAVIQVELQRGPNQILFRCANDPQNGADRRAKHVRYFENFADSGLHHPRGALDHTSFRLSLHAGGQVGNLTVSDPVAPDLREPPLVWDLDSGLNVRWSQPLPLGHATPVLHGTQMFVSAEPASLICLDAESGSVRWQRNFAGGGTENAGSYLAATCPVVAENRVWAAFGTGTLVCLDHEGKELWKRDIPSYNDPVLGNPVLAEGHIIVQLPGPPRAKGESTRHNTQLAAFDAETGAPVWATQHPVGFGAGFCLVQLPGGSFLGTASGRLVDARDGSVAHDQLTTIAGNGAAPVWGDGKLIWNSTLGVEAVRVFADAAHRVNARPLWRTRRISAFGQNCANGRYGKAKWFRSGVLANGIFHSLRYDTAHVPNHYPVSWLQVDAYETTNGQPVAQIRPVLRESLDPCAEPVAAGGVIFFMDGGSPIGGFGGEDRYGKIAVVDARFPPAVIAQNVIPRTRAAPLSVGNRLYIRSFDSLVCLEVKDEAGRRAQTQALRKNLFDRIGERPREETALQFAGLESVPPTLPINGLQDKKLPANWLYLGPYSETVAEREAQVLAGNLDGLAPTALDPAFLLEERLDLFGPTGKKPGTRSYFTCAIDVAIPTTFRFNLRLTGLRVFVDGTEVPNKKAFRLESGLHRFVLLSDLPARLPSFGTVTAELAFTPIEDPDEALNNWLEQVRLYESGLRNIAADEADSRWKRLAVQYLEYLGPPTDE